MKLKEKERGGVKRRKIKRGFWVKRRMNKEKEK